MASQLGKSGRLTMGPFRNDEVTDGSQQLDAEKGAAKRSVLSPYAERSVSVWRIVRSEAVHCCRVRSVTATCEED
jgi:hypothetical protein